MVSFTKTKENITMVLDGELITFNSEHPKFEEIAKKIDEGDTMSLLEYLAPMMGAKRQKMNNLIRLLRASKAI